MSPVCSHPHEVRTRVMDAVEGLWKDQNMCWNAECSWSHPELVLEWPSSVRRTAAWMLHDSPHLQRQKAIMGWTRRLVCTRFTSLKDLRCAIFRSVLQVWKLQVHHWAGTYYRRRILWYKQNILTIFLATPLTSDIIPGIPQIRTSRGISI